MGDQVSLFLAVMCHHFKVNTFPFSLQTNPVSSGQGWFILSHILQPLNTALCLKSLATFVQTHSLLILPSLHGETFTEVLLRA